MCGLMGPIQPGKNKISSAADSKNSELKGMYVPIEYGDISSTLCGLG